MEQLNTVMGKNSIYVFICCRFILQHLQGIETDNGWEACDVEGYTIRVIEGGGPLKGEMSSLSLSGYLSRFRITA